MKRYWRSLQFRLVISYLGLSLLVLTIVGFTFSAVLSAYAGLVQRQRMAEYAARVQMLAEQARLARTPAAEFEALVKRQLPQLEVYAVTVPRDELRAAPAPRPERDVEPALGRMVIFSGLDRGSIHEWRLAYVSIMEAPVLFTFRLAPQPGAVFAALMFEVVGALLAIFILAGLVGWWLSRWLSRSLARLTDATTAVAAGNFQQNVPPTGVNELDRLAEQFNQMVQNLRDSFFLLQSERDLARRFAGDAAHELRTPVAALRAYSDVLADRPERLGAVMPGLGRQVQRMEGAIQGLLELSRLGEGTGVTLAAGDLAEAVRLAAPGLDALAEDYGHLLRLSVPTAPVPVRFDRRLLELVLQNLVENAGKFTPEGGEIAVAVRTEEGRALLEVADNGRGIPADELPYIFERFHRGLNTQAIPGTGLGLTIVKEAVDRMNGEVSVTSAVGQGSRFTVALPMV